MSKSRPGALPELPVLRPPPRVVLASESPYRRELLQRLLSGFATHRPAVDETPLPAESPLGLARRLASIKAAAGALAYPDAVVIGSDQVATLGATVLGKPGTSDRAVAQLVACSGQTVEFLTAVCICRPGPEPDLLHVDSTRVRFRTFTAEEARDYVAADQPLDCAGSFRAERRGVILMDSIESSDPTGIIGLPLIWVAAGLRASGIELLRR